MPEILPTISAQHFHTAVHNEEQLAALEEASCGRAGYRLDETRYRYAPSGRKAGTG